MRSSRLVTTDDWPEAELRAAVLAGDLVAVGGCWASVAEPADPGLRAASFRWSVGDDRIIASGRSAAWIWGGCSRPPLPHDACVDDGQRARQRGSGRVREVAVAPGDIAVLAGVRVTTPEWTALDLLRTAGPSEWAARADTLQGLLAVTGTPTSALRTRLAVLGTVPMVRQAERRLAGLDSGISAR